MKKIFALAAVVLGLTFASCTSYRPIAAASGTVGEKKGESKGTMLFGIPTEGDCSILTAANRGGIKHIATVDQKYFSFLGLYTEITTIVTGE